MKFFNKILGLTLGLAVLSSPLLAADDLVEQGRRIYMEGVLPSGAPLEALRASNLKAEGRAVACVQCHRPSGMGGIEGDVQIRPITGNYLYHIGRKNMATMDPRIGKRMNQAHKAYTDETLTRAINQGINSEDTNMHSLMPRFSLAQDDMLALQAYLKQLSHVWSPGVDATSIRIATVVTPEVEPERRKVFLDMIDAAVAQKNGSVLPGRRHMTSPAEMLGVTERNLKLEIWELSGAPETWKAQLEEKYRDTPVFAIVSGLSNTTWAPVAEFCEQNHVPNWFPSVDEVPVSAGHYTVYFTRGVAMEADVLGKYLPTLGKGQGTRRLVQIYRPGSAGATGAAQLRLALASSGYKVQDRVLDAQGDESLKRALRDTGSANDVVMLWLGTSDLAALDDISPPARAQVYVSGRLARGQNAPLPVAWKKRVRMIYPYLLPSEQDANLTTFHVWMDLRKFPQVDEVMQSEFFFAMTYFTMTVSEMLDNLYGDYLLERAENMLSRQETTRSLDETRMRSLAGQSGAMTRIYGERASPAGIHRETLDRLTSVQNKQTGTSIYPNLSLGAGQRFASKGAYITRFLSPESNNIAPESAWIVP